MPDVTAPVVILAAGRGSRLERLTRFASKELLPLGDDLVLSHILAEIQDAGAEDVLIVSRPGKSDIDAYVARITEEGGFDLRIRLLYQGDIPGNGGAILTAAAEIGPRPFVVVWGDEVFLGPSRVGQLVTAYEQLGAPCICLRPVREEDVSRCGIAEAEPDENGLLRIRRILEKPAPTATASRMASIGGFVLESALVDTLADTPRAADGEVYLSAALDAYAQRAPLYGVPIAARWFETGSYEGYSGAFVAFAEDRGLIQTAPDIGEGGC